MCGSSPRLPSRQDWGVSTDDEDFIVKAAVSRNIVDDEGSHKIARNLRLTIDGWQHFEELQCGAVTSRPAFMAMPFGGPSSELVRMAYGVFKQAAADAGFNLSNPLLENPKAGLIDDHIRDEISLTSFLVAELTGGNHGAYWEAGFAEGLGKKVIYTCEEDWFKGKGVHFDTSHLQTVVWKRDGLLEAGQKLKDIIRNTFPADAQMNDL